MKIKLTKINIANNPKVETATLEEYKFGEINEKSIPLEYEIVGEVGSMPKVGFVFSGIRTIRNGIEMPGIFQLTRIKEITEEEGKYILKTQNSVYKMEILEKDEKTLA